MMWLHMFPSLLSGQWRFSCVLVFDGGDLVLKWLPVCVGGVWLDKRRGGAGREEKEGGRGVERFESADKLPLGTALPRFCPDIKAQTV